MFTIESIDGTFSHLISEFCQATFRHSEVFSPSINTLSVRLFKSVQFGQLYRKLHNNNRMNSTRKSRI